MSLICMRQTVHTSNLMMMINIGDNIMTDLWDVLIIGVFFICLPLMYTIAIGTFLATSLGLTGIIWWSFVILCLIIFLLFSIKRYRI